MTTTIAQLATALATSLKSLEDHLVARPSGYELTLEDATAFTTIGCAPDENQFPQAARWYKRIASTADAERDAWPAGQDSVTLTAEATKKDNKPAQEAAPAAEPVVGEEEDDEV